MFTPSYWTLVELLAGRRPVVLTGAGCSTESGIPDYRGPGAPKRERGPIQYREFTRDAAARRRYWARSVRGWPTVDEAEPNPAHLAIARLEHSGLIGGVITQNVDGLHHKAGSRRVVELHGNLARVVCMQCGEEESRSDTQARLLETNPTSPVASGSDLPDGDAYLPGSVERRFEPVDCRRCGGMLKPDVVFFGENVPKPRVKAAWRMYEQADALLVVGSSLTVFSGYRFVLRAARERKPVGIVNIGPTRGDADAAVRVHGRAGDVLPLLADDLRRC